ncbi:necrosis inducing protein [Fusarium denticulatum]|uniref:Necrosis inducing protein n=1 Tax=Fusarium denticulatum TaxID=48507 RepID=A0A8H5UC97_9HYPO|nr:necrosis inducing protein [Fusarium denticulatum]
MHIPPLLFSILGVVSIAAAIPSRVPKLVRLIPTLQKLDANADEDSLRYQPVLYSGKNNCSHAAAIYKNGTINPGITPYAGCHDKPRRDGANVYTRKRCNNGWCAYMYEYYFEASKFLGLGLREPKWEHVVVFVKNNAIQHVAASAKGEYIRSDKPLLQDSHPMMVYQQIIFLPTQGFQFAEKKHVEMVKKGRAKWYMGDLVGWHGFPSPELRKKLSTHDFGKAKFHLADEPFAKTLEEAAGKNVPGFNCQMDETPDMPEEKQKEKVKSQEKYEVQENEQKSENIEEKDSNKKFDINEKQNKQEKKEEYKEEEKKKFDIKEKEEEKKFDIEENVKDKEEDKKGDEKEDEKQFDIKKQKDEDK